MFGDFLFSHSVDIISSGSSDITAQFPLGSLGVKVGDNSSPMPRDRVFYRLNYFHNAVNTGQRVGGGSGVETNSHSRSLGSHLVGFERTFLDQTTSVELRAPFANRVDIADSGDTGLDDIDYTLSAGGEGNLFVTTKFLLRQEPNAAWSAGLGLQVPTGRDVYISHESIDIAVRNQSVHLHPYLACLQTPSNQWFCQAFLELNIPVSDNEISFTGLGDPDETAAFAPPVLMSFDYSVGYWFFRDHRQQVVTGLAGLFELHYTTSVNNPGVVVDSRDDLDDFGVTSGDGRATAGRPSILNLTTGVHFEIGRQSSFRIAGVFPVADRQFENEFTFQWNRYY